MSLRTSVALGVMDGALAFGTRSAVAAYRMGDRALLRLSSARPLASGDSAIFATHPRTIDRVNRLRALQGLPPLPDDPAIHESTA